ncbi:MAG: alginate lyase family protein [Treponema sp.]|jgi:hypothetical protein|nr:alginate lyase family protein [Treponema sp.]
MKDRIAAFLWAAVLLLAACKIESSVPARIGMVHPGAPYTQEDFVAMSRLITRWTNGVTPSGPPSDPPTVQDDLGLTWANHDAKIPPDKIAAYREARRANRKMYGEYRAYQNYTALVGDGEGASSYGMARGYDPFIGRDGEVAGTKTGVEADMRAAYKNALRWMLSGDKLHAQKTFQILDTYAQNLRGFKDGGMGDRMLMVGLQGYLYAAAAEIIRYGRNVINGEDSGYIPEQFGNIDRSIREVWLAEIQNCYLNVPAWRAGNQDAMLLTAYLAIAIYLDDQVLFQKALEAFCFGENNGSLKRNIHHVSGQNQETTRDQSHALLAEGKLALGCEIAYKQGYDAYELYDHALLKASEFGARYNLGDNNFQSYISGPSDPYGPYYYFERTWELALWGGTVIGSGDRGGGSVFPYELAYNHYVRREGLEMPWTEAILPSGGEGWNASDAAPGYSSFLAGASELVRELGL